MCVCVGGVDFRLVISMCLGHACVNRVSHMQGSFPLSPYMNNIIVNYLRPNLFCYNFPGEQKHMWAVLEMAGRRSSFGLITDDITAPR